MSIVRAREYEYARPHTHACFYTHCFRAWASTASWSNYSTLLCPSCYKLVPVKHAVFAPRTFLQIRGLAVETTRTRTVKSRPEQGNRKRRRNGEKEDNKRQMATHIPVAFYTAPFARPIGKPHFFPTPPFPCALRFPQGKDPCSRGGWQSVLQCVRV